MSLIRWFFSLFRQPPTLAIPPLPPAPPPMRKRKHNRKRGRGSNYARLNPDVSILQQARDLDRR